MLCSCPHAALALTLRSPRRWEQAKPPTGGEDRRKVASLLYLNDGWQPHNGGEELLLDEGGGCWRSVSPAADTLLVYRTDRVLHKVAPTRGGTRCALSLTFLGSYQ